MDAHGETTHSDHPETFNPWSIVNLVFHHLADEGLHPVLGEAGDPGNQRLTCCGRSASSWAVEGNRIEVDQRNQRLAEIRAAFEMSHVESPWTLLSRCDAAHKDFRGCWLQPLGP